MTEKTINQFTALSGSVAGADELALWDASAAGTRRVSVTNFIANSPNGGLAEKGVVNTFTANQIISPASATNSYVQVQVTGGQAWRFGLENHATEFRIRDEANNKYPVKIVSNSPDNSIFISTSGVSIGTSSPVTTLAVNGAFALVDGMTAPSTAGGWAKIYIDSADGDLKIKFGDGTVKTIVVDT